MQYYLLVSILLIHGVLRAQMDSMPYNKLPGDNFLQAEYRFVNGEKLPDNYKKVFMAFEGGDSVRYLEKYSYNKQWSVTRYLSVEDENILSGWQRFYNMDGTLDYEIYCDGGKRHCKTMLRYAWYPGGQLLAVGTYYKNTPEGSFYFYYANGQMRQHAYYAKGRFMEVLAYYDQDGNIMDAGTLCDGEGTANVYSLEGVLIQIKSFSKGKIRKTVTVGESENQNIH